MTCTFATYAHCTLGFPGVVLKWAEGEPYSAGSSYVANADEVQFWNEAGVKVSSYRFDTFAGIVGHGVDLRYGWEGYYLTTAEVVAVQAFLFRILAGAPDA